MDKTDKVQSSSVMFRVTESNFILSFFAEIIKAVDTGSVGRKKTCDLTPLTVYLVP